MKSKFSSSAGGGRGDGQAGRAQGCPPKPLSRPAGLETEELTEPEPEEISDANE